MHLSLFTTFCPPNIFVCPPNIFDKSTPVSTLTVQSQWYDEMVREKTGHPPSYKEAKKMKSPTLHTHGCLKANLMDYPFSFSFSSGYLFTYFYLFNKSLWLFVVGGPP